VAADSAVDPESTELLMPTSRDLYRGTIR
jgi:hypothetical protein